MKIVNNFKTNIIEKGDILEGSFSGEYYLVLTGGKIINLNSLIISNLDDTVVKHTGIKRENVTITFE